MNMNHPTRPLSRPRRNASACTGAIAALALLFQTPATASDPTDTNPAHAEQLATPERWSVHGQFTTVVQHHPAFRSPYEGPNSLKGADETKATNDATLFLGARLWQGAEVYANPEIDQGFGLSDTLGAGGYPSGEAYKVGATKPYFRLPRLFLRQTLPLSDEFDPLEAGANQLAGSSARDNLTLTLGKFSVTDIFDTNRYAHDPRADFLNWSVVDSGAFDYAADAWGYSTGIALEWRQSWWTLRGGVFNLSSVPNSKELGKGFDQFAAVGEWEIRHSMLGHEGKIKLLGFLNRGRMAAYDDAVAYAQAHGGAPDVTQVRRYASRPGAALNVEQDITPALGVFFRASANQGSKEAFEFTEINRSFALGASMKASAWQRPDDTFGFAVVENQLSSSARGYFAAGGMGILIGDGQLANSGAERILETFYALRIAEPLTVSLDYQYLAHPAYNRDRGPVSIFGARVHAEF